MSSNFRKPEVERQLVKTLISDPMLAKKKVISETWFTNNPYRMIVSYLNFYQGQYTTAEKVQLKLKSEPIAKKINVDKVFADLYNVPAAKDVDSLIDNLHLTYQKRKLSILGEKVSNDPSQENIDNLVKTRDELKSTAISSKEMFLNASKNVLKSLNTPKDNFIKTYPKLDQMFNGGLTGNQLFIIGARPSVGKTAFGLNLAYNALLNTPDITIEIFSLEMSNEQNLKRIYANISGIPVAKWSDPARKMNDKQKEIAAKTISRISSFKIFMNDKAIQIDDICESIQRHANELPQGKYLPIIDHFHLIENHSTQDFRHALEINSRRLKLLTQTLNIPIVLLAQLNRASTARQDQRPQLSDLRDTGTLEQDANIVGMLYSDSDDDQDLELIIRKNRDGSLGTDNFVFEKGIQKLTEIGDINV